MLIVYTPQPLSPGSGRIAATFKVPGRIIGWVKRELGRYSGHILLHGDYFGIPQDAWAAPATVSRCGCIDNAIYSFLMAVPL